MTTSNAIGSDIIFWLKSDGFNNPGQIDFGDGNLINIYTSNNGWPPILGKLVGSQNIKIYGTGITYLQVNDPLYFIRCIHGPNFD